MSRVGGKTHSNLDDAALNDYEQQRLETIEANKMRMQTLGIKHIAASMTSLVDSSKTKKRQQQCNATLEKDGDYVPDENEENEYEEEAHIVTTIKRKFLILDLRMIKMKRNVKREKRKSLNKKYRNYRARLNSVYYDTESTDEERLKEENIPPNVDENDWKWLVKYFGLPKFKGKSTRNIDNRSYQDAGHTAGTKSFAQKVEDMFERDKVMPTMLEVYKETHSKSDKTPITEVAKETLVNEDEIEENKDDDENEEYDEMQTDKEE